MTTFIEYNQIIDALPSKDKDSKNYYKYNRFKKNIYKFI